MQRLLKHWHSHQQLRYLLTGAWNTAAGYAIFALLYLLLGSWLNYLLVAVVAHVAAVTQSFVTQRRLVFRSKGNWSAEYFRFHLAHLTTLVIGLGLLSTLVEDFAMSPLTAQAIITAIIVLISYFVHQHFTFRRAKDV